MKSLLMLILLFFTLEGNSQTRLEEKNIEEIDSVVQNNLIIDHENNYLVYSVGNKIVVIDSLNKKAYYIERFSDQKVLTKKVSRKCVKSFFNKKNIKEGDLFSNKIYDESCVSSFVYLSLIKKGSKTFQFHLPFMLMCDKNKVKYPFSDEILEKLHETLVMFNI